MQDHSLSICNPLNLSVTRSRHTPHIENVFNDEFNTTPIDGIIFDHYYATYYSQSNDEGLTPMSIFMTSLLNSYSIHPCNVSIERDNPRKVLCTQSKAKGLNCFSALEQAVSADNLDEPSFSLLNDSVSSVEYVDVNHNSRDMADRSPTSVINSFPLSFEGIIQQTKSNL